MDRTSEQWAVPEGTDVVGADGAKVGEVVAVRPTYLVVEKGFFFPTDYYVPTSAVAEYDDERVYLRVTKEEALTQGWDAVPAEDAAASATAAGTGSRRIRSRTELDADDVPFEHYEDSDRTHLDAEQGIVVPVHEEELTAVTRERAGGRVEVTTDVVAEERVLEVPVTEERVRVERHLVDRDAPADAAAFQEETIAVPLRAEEVELQTRTRVREEIEIAKEAVRRTEQVRGTVRREVVDVRERTVETERAAGAADPTVSDAGPADEPRTR